MSGKMLGLLNLHHSPNLGEMTTDRTLASTSFLGRYAFMDFALSNFTNSGIDQVGILVKEKPRSLLKHLGSRNTWNVNTKTGFENIMYNESAIFNRRYNTDFANIRTNDWVMRKSTADYIVFAPAHFICAIDYRKVLQEHIANNAAITLIYAPVDRAKDHFIGSDIVTLNNDGLVINLRSNKGTANTANISLEMYIINRPKLMELMEKSNEISSFFGLHDIIAFSCNAGERVHGYRYDGFVRCFDSMEHYIEYSLELLNYKYRQQLFLPEWPIYTVTHDTPPAFYDQGAEVRNSFIANGAQIYGKVQNSIISRDVVIEPGAKVVDSIVLTQSVIGSNVCLCNAIVDKYCHVKFAKEVNGEESHPAYVHQGDQI
ncbi:MAG TPA: glucose-1-phosphate adenylyltransferase subunit GlgD [Bacilli bacterium]|nr:glucose-1-phosphate adenylyltransferase subunit GlgD [Bacilli bacterium]